jgi:hypothetical protein
LPVSGQTTPLAEALVSARYTLTVGANGFSGAGARVLANAIDQAQFVAIGEDHLTREIPLFTAHVCDQMSRHGLDAIALEIGTEAARFAQSTLGRPNRVELMQALQRKYPDSIAFVSDKQENDLHRLQWVVQDLFTSWSWAFLVFTRCTVAMINHSPMPDSSWIRISSTHGLLLL